MAAISHPQGAMVIAWKPARLVGAEMVNEPGAMTWNDLLTSDVEAAREFYAALFGWKVDPVPESAGRYWIIKGPDGSNGGMMPLPTEASRLSGSPTSRSNRWRLLRRSCASSAVGCSRSPWQCPAAPSSPCTTLKARLSRC